RRRSAAVRWAAAGARGGGGVLRRHRPAHRDHPGDPAFRRDLRVPADLFGDSAGAVDHGRVRDGPEYLMPASRSFRVPGPLRRASAVIMTAALLGLSVFGAPAPA